jgi:endonuclease VIII
VPEGDSVWRAAKRLRPALEGKQLTGCDVRVPRFATVDLSGRTVDEIVTRGKHLLMRVGDATIHTHLKMEGEWHIYPPGARWRRPAYRARIVLSTKDAVVVGFSLGITEILARSEEDRVIGHLGPDLLGADWDPDEAVARLRSDPLRPVGLALLDQRNLAGIGNIFRSEACFMARVDPRTAVGDVADLHALIEHARILLTQSIQTQRHRSYVYGRARMPCPRCRTTIRKLDQSDSPSAERYVFICPKCQPAPT